MIVAAALFWICAFIIFWAMIGYQLSLKIIAKLLSNKKLEKTGSLHQAVTVIIVAHNEEKVIHNKLLNMIDNDYPGEEVEYIVTSDFSTDKTCAIVRAFIKEHPEHNIRLHETKEHKGKTNAQNEAQAMAAGSILIMTDANAMFERNAISELVSCFCADDIAYVCGKLSYLNTDQSIACAESTYWEGDLAQREIESNIKTITAGNGAIYACRNAMYCEFDPIRCHDSSMPPVYARRKLRALYNPDAIAYEKAGEVMEDEFKRKVRMNRYILDSLKEMLLDLNIIKYGWYAYFVFGHRYCRMLLWLAHLLVLILSGVCVTYHWIYAAAFVFQVAFYAAAILNLRIKAKNKVLTMISYYSMTIFAQWVGVWNCITGRSKPTWGKAESTR